MIEVLPDSANNLIDFRVSPKPECIQFERFSEPFTRRLQRSLPLHAFSQSKVQFRVLSVNLLSGPVMLYRGRKIALGFLPLPFLVGMLPARERFW